jgi:ribosome-associated protein
MAIADAFVIATVRNPRHAAAIAQDLIRELKAVGLHRRNAAGLEGESGWILLDFDDVVVHLFEEGARAFYDLENLWSDAPRIPFEPPAAAAVQAAAMRSAAVRVARRGAADAGSMGTL